VSKLIISKA